MNTDEISQEYDTLIKNVFNKELTTASSSTLNYYYRNSKNEDEFDCDFNDVIRNGIIRKLEFAANKDISFKINADIEQKIVECCGIFFTCALKLICATANKWVTQVNEIYIGYDGYDLKLVYDSGTENDIRDVDVCHYLNMTITTPFKIEDIKKINNLSINQWFNQIKLKCICNIGIRLTSDNYNSEYSSFEQLIQDISSILTKSNKKYKKFFN